MWRINKPWTLNLWGSWRSMLIIQPNGMSPTSCSSSGSKNKGCAVTNQRMSHWLVEAISLAYEARVLASPLGIRAHSKRAVASLQGWCIFYVWYMCCGRIVLTEHFCQILQPGCEDDPWLFAWAEAFLGSQLSQVRQARWYTIRWRQRSIKVTYEGENLGYVYLW